MEQYRQPIRSWLGFGLGIICFAGTLYYSLQFLLAEPVSARVPVPASQVSVATDGAASWPMPRTMRVSRWFRTPARVWEDGKPLPFRVENRDQLAAAGFGSFCADNDRLWFLGTDRPNLGLSQRRYEFEIFYTSYRSAVLAAALAAVWLGLFLQSRAVRRCLQAILAFLTTDPRLRRRLRVYAAVTLLSLAGLSLAAAIWGPPPFHRTLTLSAGEIFYGPQNVYYFYPPKWVRAYPDRIGRLVLYDQTTSLEPIDSRQVNAEARNTGFVAGNKSVQFRPIDRSNPATNGRIYRLRVCLITPAMALYLAVLFGLPGLILAAGLSQPYIGSQMRLTVWRAAIAAICLAKFYVIAGDDMTAAEADPLMYARSVVNMIWGQAMDNLPTHPSGFPFAAGLASQLGVPWRLALEGFYLAAAYWVAICFLRLSGSRVVALLAFALLSWHPYTFSGFREFMADPWVLVITLVLLASMMTALMRPADRWKWSASAQIGLCLSLWDWSRNEGPLVFASYALFVLVALLRMRVGGETPRRHRARLAGWLLLPLLILVTVQTGVKAANYWRYGVYSKSLIDSPGLMALMRALYRIETQENIRYAPVTRQSLRAACAASPTLRRFEEKLLDPQQLSTRLGQQGTGIKGEFGPYLNWLLPQSMPADLRLANRLMLQSADEVETALRAGQLPQRSAHFPLDPHYNHWVPSLIGYIREAFRNAAQLVPAPEPWGGIYHQNLILRVFDEAANRRATLTYPGQLMMDGILSGPAKTVDSVALLDDQNRMIGASALKSNWWGDRLVFDLRVPLEEKPARGQLMLLYRGQIRQSIPFRADDGQLASPAPDRVPFAGLDFRLGSSLPLDIPIADTGERLQGSIQWDWVVNAKKSRRIACERWLAPYYPRCFWLALIMVAAIVWTGGELGPSRLGALGAGVLLAFGWLGLRASLYGLVLANVGWWVTRYMQCVSPVYVILLMLLAIGLAALARLWLKAPSSLAPTAGGRFGEIPPSSR